MDEQIVKDWPGLCKYADKVMDELEIDGAFSTEINKKQFKKLVKEACKKKNHESLKSSISEYKKMKALRDEVVKGNGYFYTESLKNVRTLFRFRTDMFQAKENFKNIREYKEEEYLCDLCESKRDDNMHVLFCESYKQLREGKSMNNDKDLCEYLQKVLEIRAELRINR